MGEELLTPIADSRSLSLKETLARLSLGFRGPRILSVNLRTASTLHNQKPGAGVYATNCRRHTSSNILWCSGYRDNSDSDGN